MSNSNTLRSWIHTSGGQRLKRAVLATCKALGLFRIARRVTRDGLRILCYHGFSMGDEAEFRPTMYMPPDTFRARLDFLRRHDFPVLPLSEAIVLLEKNQLPAGATVVTIDDGWFSTYAIALPILRQYAIPATLYVTTYHVEKETPVFSMCVSYVFWKTRANQVDFSGLGLPSLEHEVAVDLGTGNNRQRIANLIIEHGENHCNETGRCDIAHAVAALLGVDYTEIRASRRLSLVNEEELGEMFENAIDIQLHTHRHRFPINADLVHVEIQDNRAVLEKVTGSRLTHFCYPSGYWSREHWPMLQSLGVKTGTTCEPGLAYRDTPKLALNRILDSVLMTPIEFEAEMFGFSDLLRRGLCRIGLGETQ